MRFLKLVVAFSALIISMMGCGGGSSLTVPPPPPPVPSSISVTVTFAGISPNDTVAVQMGTGAFTAQTLQNGQLNLTLPSITSKYAIAWHCVLGVAPNSFGDFVLEVTPQDGIAFTVGCPSGFAQTMPPSGLVQITGSVDASAIAGVHAISIYGHGGAGSVIAASGAFSIFVSSGLNDVAFLALDSSNNVLAVKILRNQTAPGAINGGSTVTFGPADMVADQPLTLNNIPAGFLTPPDREVSFQTMNGTSFPLVISDTTQYAAVPAAAFQTGDSYVFSTQTRNNTTLQALAVAQSSTTGGPVTLAFPQPWSYSGPTPASLPTLTFNYSGFTGLPVVTEDARISRVAIDAGEPVFLSLEVLATGSYQNAANTITIPDLSVLPGSTHFAGVPSGTSISWSAFITAGSAPETQFLPNLGANNMVSSVGNSGSYTVP